MAGQKAINATYTPSRRVLRLECEGGFDDRLPVQPRAFRDLLLPTGNATYVSGAATYAAVAQGVLYLAILELAASEGPDSLEYAGFGGRLRFADGELVDQFATTVKWD
jgi:hypothetical protein